MKNKNAIKFMTILLLALLLLLGGWLIYSMRYQGSDIYPYYSSFRSDRMGTKVLYESLKSFPELEVERNFRPSNELTDNQDICLFILGCSPGSLHVDFKEIEDNALRGERVIVSFTPAREWTKKKIKKCKCKKDDKEKKEEKKEEKKDGEKSEPILKKCRSGVSGISLQDLGRELRMPAKAVCSGTIIIS